MHRNPCFKQINETPADAVSTAASCEQRSASNDTACVDVFDERIACCGKRKKMKYFSGV
jgi:hypothetical protein